MCFSLTATTWRLIGGTDVTSINTNPPVYTCGVGMREGGGGDIKRKGNMEEKKGRNLVRKLKKNI